MTLLSRAPRQVYRVYDEQEFLAAQAGAEKDRDTATSRHPHRSRVVVASTLLLTTTATVGAITVRPAPRDRGGRRPGSLAPPLARAQSQAQGAKVLPAPHTEGIVVHGRHERRGVKGRGQYRPRAHKVPAAAAARIETATVLARPQAAVSGSPSPDPHEFGFER